jgi:lysozyme family protein
MAINEFQNMPKWVEEGLNHSSVLNDMKDSLRILSERKSPGSKEQKDLEKTTKSFNNLGISSKKLATSLGEAAAGTKKGAKEIDYYHKTLAQHTKNLAHSISSSGLTGIAGSLSNSFLDMASKGGKLSQILALTGEGVKFLYDTMKINAKAFYDLADVGVNVGGALTGITTASLNANMSIDDFTKVLKQNADIEAITADLGGAKMSKFIKSLQFGDRSVFKLGYTLEQSLDAYSEWNQIQKLSGQVNNRTKEGFQSFLDEVTGLTTDLGISRKDIIDNAKKAAQDPNWQAYLMTLGKNGKKVADSMTQFSTNITAVTSKDYGSKLTTMMQEMVSSGGVPLTEASRQIYQEISSTSPAFRNLIDTTVNQIAAGKNLTNYDIEALKVLKQTTDAQLKAANITASASGGVSTSLGELTNSINIAKQVTLDDISRKKEQQKVDAETAAVVAEFEATLSNFNKTLGSLFMTLLSDMGLAGLSKSFTYITTVVLKNFTEAILWISKKLHIISGEEYKKMMNEIGEKTHSQQRDQKRQDLSKSNNIDNMLDLIMEKNEGGGKLIRDTGGWTKWGISEKSNPGINIAGLTKEQAKEIYKQKYLAPLKGFNNLSPEAQFQALDASINQGEGYANKFISESGGNASIIASLRKQRYNELVRRDPITYAQYARGWNNRVDNTSVMAQSLTSTGVTEKTPVSNIDYMAQMVESNKQINLNLQALLASQELGNYHLKNVSSNTKDASQIL